MAIATPNPLTDNRIRYVTNTEGKTIDVIVPVELWQQILNSINPDSIISKQEDNLESFALQNLEGKDLEYVEWFGKYRCLENITQDLQILLSLQNIRQNVSI